MTPEAIHFHTHQRPFIQTRQTGPLYPVRKGFCFVKLRLVSRFDMFLSSTAKISKHCIQIPETISEYMTNLYTYIHVYMYIHMELVSVVVGGVYMSVPSIGKLYKHAFM